MKTNNFRGDLTDISAVKEALDHMWFAGGAYLELCQLVLAGIVGGTSHKGCINVCL